jgi:hypothetical protein
MEIDDENEKTNNNENNKNNSDNNSIILKSNFEKDKSLVISKNAINLIPNLNIYLDSISYNIPFKYLNLIKEYCEHHNFEKPKPITMPLQYNDFSKCINDKWDYDFIMKLSINESLEFVNYFNELKCESLYYLCCARIGFYFRCENIKKIKKDFNLLVTKFTTDEKNKIIEENSWLNDI